MSSTFIFPIVMTNLQLLLIVVSISFMLLSVQIYKRRKIWLFTFFFFFFGAMVVGVLSLRIERLNMIGITFGLNRGADLIVYVSIMGLFYLILSLYNIVSKYRFDLTKLVSELAIQQEGDRSLSLLSQTSLNGPRDRFILNIRVYNEAHVLSRVIDDLLAFGITKMLFINDGSTDQSLKILQQKQLQNPEVLIIILSHSMNRGGGAANKTGFTFLSRYAQELNVDWIVGFDPDGQMDIENLYNFRAAINNHPKTDLFLGSRFISGASTTDMPMLRRCILWISKVVTRWFYGVKVSDPHNGYRVISLDALKKIQLSADGMHYANEFNEQIALQKLKYVEVPVDISYSDYSLAKGQKNSNSFKLAFQMFFGKFFGK